MNLVEERRKSKQISLSRANLKFKNVTTLKEYTNNVILENLDIIINSKSSIYPFIIDLYERHPDFAFEPTEFIFLTFKKRYRSPSLTTDFYRGETYRPHYRDPNGHWKPFSIQKCVSAKDYNYNYNLLSVLRNEISEQIRDWRRENPKCVICKCNDIALLDVDHITSFHKLATDWMENRPRYLFYKEGIKPYFVDKEISQNWKLYHSEKAILQTLCKDCHKKVTKERLI